MIAKDKLFLIKCKQVFETGSEKDFIRAKDIVWLIDTIEKQKNKIHKLDKFQAASIHIMTDKQNEKLINLLNKK